jgi:hypothetical protein
MAERNHLPFPKASPPPPVILSMGVCSINRILKDYYNCSTYLRLSVLKSHGLSDMHKKICAESEQGLIPFARSSQLAQRRGRVEPHYRHARRVRRARLAG